MDPKNHIFLEYDTKRYTYSQLYTYCNAFYKRFAKADTDDGPIAFIPDRSETSIFFIAASWLTGIPIFLVPHHLNNDERTRLFNRLVPRQIIDAKDETLSCTTEGDTDSSFLSSLDLVHDHTDQLDDLTKVHSTLTHNFQDLSSICGYFLTSGTTGDPKIVPLSRTNIERAATNSGTNFPLSGGDLWATSLPLHHIGGCSVIYRAIIKGFGILYLSDFHSGTYSKIISSDMRVRAVSMVPTQLKRLLDETHIMPHNRFIGILLGGGPTHHNLIKRSRELSIPVIPSFGMTETSAQCIAIPYDSINNAPFETCGKPFPGIQVQLLPDTSGGEIKTLWIKGAQIFDGYYDNRSGEPEFQNGFFNTGDVARIDEQGWIYIEMRRTDRIVTGGENVNPVEIEQILSEMPDVLDVAVIGIEDEEWGQRVTAVMQLAERHSLTHTFLNSFLSQRLPRFKIPKQYYQVDQLPRTLSGKLKRSEIPAMISSARLL